MELLDGKIVKQKVLEEVRELAEKENVKLGLAVVQVGDDEASKVYVGQKEKMANALNFNFIHQKLSADVTQEELLSVIDKLNKSKKIHGILVQMPIPKHLDSKEVQNRILSYKDVDGLTDLNAGMLIHGKEGLVPCTPQGIVDLLKYYKIELEGKNVTIIGRSDLVGKPLAALMINNNATVTLCHSKTKDLREFTKKADIVVAAVGKAKLIKRDDLKKGAVVVDVGINRMEDGKLCGDVDFDDVKSKVSYITPVPGGVGQMTVAELAMNTYKAYLLGKKNNK